MLVLFTSYSLSYCNQKFEIIVVYTVKSKMKLIKLLVFKLKKYSTTVLLVGIPKPLNSFVLNKQKFPVSIFPLLFVQIFMYKNFTDQIENMPILIQSRLCTKQFKFDQLYTYLCIILIFQNNNTFPPYCQ